jgi:hypothetical protein
MSVNGMDDTLIVVIVVMSLRVPLLCVATIAICAIHSTLVNPNASNPDLPLIWTFQQNIHNTIENKRFPCLFPFSLLSLTLGFKMNK